MSGFIADRVGEVAHESWIKNRHTGTFAYYPFSVPVNTETVNPFTMREILEVGSSEGLAVDNTVLFPCNGAYGQSTGGNHIVERASNYHY